MFSVKFDLKRSVEIQKPAAQIYKIISNFDTWSTWSPWLCQEPECPVEIVGESGQIGHSQTWVGQSIGSGKLTLANVIENQQLDYNLVFQKPWKIEAKTSFLLKKTENGTRVTWLMQSSLPFFMFIMKKMMIALISNDYDRGLNMLNDLAVSGEVHNRIQVNDVQQREGFSYITLRNSCSLSEIGTAMDTTLSQVKKQADTGQIPQPDFILSFYHQVDMVKNIYDFSAGYGYSNLETTNAPDGFIIGKVESHQALNVEHNGPYRHLGNAWAAIFGTLRNGKLKQEKKIPQYEIYRHNPHQVEEKDIQTSLYMPVISLL